MSCFGCFSSHSSEPTYGEKPQRQQQPQQLHKPQQVQGVPPRTGLRPQTPGATNSGPLKPGGAQQHARLQSQARVSPTNSDCTEIAELPTPPASPKRTSPRASANGSAAAPAQRLTPPQSFLGSPPPSVFLGTPPQQSQRPVSSPRITPAFEDPLPPVSRVDGSAASGPPELRHNSPPSFKGFMTGKENAKAQTSGLHDLPSGDMWAPRQIPSLAPVGPTGFGPRSTDPGPSDVDAPTNSRAAELEAHPITDVRANSWASEASSTNLSAAEALSDAQGTPLGAEQLTADGIRRSLSPRTRLPEEPGRANGLASLPERSDSKVAGGGLASTRSGSLSGAPSEPGLAGADLYEVVGQLGISRTGVMKLMRDKRTQELVAAKWINHIQGETLSVNAEREIVNHRRLLHPNVIRFREVYATEDEFLVIVMEYASGGHLGERIATSGALSEEKAKKLFQMLVDGMSYCHRQGIVHRNLRMENMLLDGNFFQPLLKISGFAYSKAPDLDSAPKTLAMGSPAYTPPEMLMAVRNEGSSYDGRAMDVWSAGIILFNMVTGQLPFQDPSEPGVLTRKLMKRLVGCQYEFPVSSTLSPECKDLISKILVADPKKRIQSHLISSHPWLAGSTIETPRPAAPIIPMSKQSESDISDVMVRARKRRAARQKLQPKVPAAFNEDLLDEI